MVAGGPAVHRRSLIVAYRNGRVPKEALIEIAPGEQLAWVAAEAWMVMKRAAAGDGIRLDPYRWGTYRDLPLQAAMHRNPSAYGVAKGVKVAEAGTSTHGFGMAVDIRFGLVWAYKNAARFGFTRTMPKNDPAHFVHDGRTIPTPPPPDQPAIDTSLPRRQKEDSMYVAGVGAPDITYCVSTDANGHPRMRVIGEQERAAVITGGLLIRLNDERLAGLGVECGWVGGRPPVITSTMTSVDTTVITEAINAMPASILHRFREFWTSGK